MNTNRLDHLSSAGNGNGEFAAPHGTGVHRSCAVSVSDIRSQLIQDLRPID